MEPLIKIILVGLGVRGMHWINVINKNKLALISGCVDINPLSKDKLLKYKFKLKIKIYIKIYETIL